MSWTIAFDIIPVIVQRSQELLRIRLDLAEAEKENKRDCI